MLFRSPCLPYFPPLPPPRCDITVLLLCVEQLMWSVCDGPEALVRSQPSAGGWAPIVHSLCEQLLAVLVVVTAPLPQLCA